MTQAFDLILKHCTMKSLGPGVLGQVFNPTVQDDEYISSQQRIYNSDNTICIITKRFVNSYLTRQ